MQFPLRFEYKNHNWHTCMYSQRSLDRLMHNYPLKLRPIHDYQNVSPLRYRRRHLFNTIHVELLIYLPLVANSRRQHDR